MSYVVLSSEKLRTTASDTETKALLYLMNFHKDSDNIYYYIVDFYNDLTGMDRFSNNMWDLQSKGNKKSYPKEIGRELVTLLKNYISEFKFNSYVLFLEGVTSSLRIDQTKNVFGIENITDKSKKSIIKGLVEESKLKTYIPNDILNEEIIGQFLDEVTFVVDTKTKADYIKEIISNHPQIIPDEEDLVAIFNEIRDKQASKKNIMSVENVVVNSPDEALNYYRHLTNDEIRLMVISRIINRNPLDKGIPLSFYPVLVNCPPEQKKLSLMVVKVRFAEHYLIKTLLSLFGNCLMKFIQ